MASVSDDGTKQWDPTGGPGGTGAWVPIGNAGSNQPSFTTPPGQAVTPLPQAQTPTPQRVAGAWGRQGDSLGPDGLPIAGTSGMAQDRDRYRGMSGRPLYGAGPQIDRTASNETRGMSMGALGLLGQRATGAETPAQRLAQQQTTGAVNGLHSGAASVKGGAMARAAAGRGAVAGGARLQAQGNQDVQALRAREMADASGQYFGAASGQRGQDLGLATSQAGLEMGQRGANDQREGFYEGIAQDTQKANLDHQLGRGEADVAASNAQNATNAARDAANRDAQKQFTNMTLGAGMGVLDAAKTDPNDPTKTGSDERMKTAVRPLTGSPKARVRERGQEYDRSMFFKNEDGKGKDALDAAIASRTGADDAHKAQIKADYARDEAEDREKTRSLFGGATRGYAASRRGQQGDMFGGGPRNAPSPTWDADHKDAPGTRDAPRYGGLEQDLSRRAGSDRGMDRFSYDIAMSDEKSKHTFGDSPMAAANRSMAPSSYEYKPEFTPPEQEVGEKNIGPMANMMEADPVAKTAIVKDPESGLLAIDKTKGLKLALGGLASLQRQVDGLERKRA